MSADVLRRASVLMRERANAAPDQPRTDADVIGVWLNSRFHLTTTPAVALAMADLFDAHAEATAPDDYVEAEDLGLQLVLEVARAYLGEDV